MQFRAAGAIALATISFGCSDGGSGSLEPPAPVVSGLDVRPDNPSCLAPARDALVARLATPRAFPHLEFTAPVALEQAPGDASRWFVVEQGGRIRAFDAVDSVATTRNFLDLTGRLNFPGGSGLLGLAFHPDFSANGRAFVTYAAPAAGFRRSILSEFTSRDGGLTLDPDSERILLAVEGGYEDRAGGRISFGADGNLYASLGKQGEILRLDVDPKLQGAPAVHVLGHADTRHWSFDRRTGSLWTGAAGRANVGGRVYRGKGAPSLAGYYVFGGTDGMIAAMRAYGGGAERPVTLATPSSLRISAFGESDDGELYLLDRERGHVRRLVFSEVHSGDNVPHTLSETGCISTSAAAAPPLMSLIPFSPNAALWSDGATKDRWIGLPEGQSISVQPEGDWEFPEGTVLVKHFRLGDRLVETRLFMRHPDGAWAGYTYQWNEEQTDATRVTDGLTIPVGGQDYTFPSEADCLWCHNDAAGFTLGPETAQLNGRLLYPQTGRTANQLTTLNWIGALAPPVGPDPPAYADHSDAGVSLEARARAYLHVNCSICHRPGGPTPAEIDLRHDTPLPDTGACDVAPSLGDLGITDARIIAPGDSARSELLSRMSRRDGFQMPPLASNRADPDGVALIGAWIDSLGEASCL